MDLAEQRCNSDEAILEHSTGIHIAKLSELPLASLLLLPEKLKKIDLMLKNTFKASSFLLVDTDIDNDNAFALPELATADMVVLVSVSAESIKNAYTMVKTVHAQLGVRTFNMLVVCASPNKANLIQRNMSIAANQYLGVKLISLGCIPPDEQLTRSSHVGRAMVDAAPMSLASAAFRVLAGKLVDNVASPKIFVKPKTEELA